MKNLFICCLLLLSTIIMAERASFTSYKKPEVSPNPEKKKTGFAIGVQGSYLFHMQNNDFKESINFSKFDHGGVGINLTIGNTQKFHTVIYGGISFYKNIKTPSSTANSKNDHIGGKFSIDLIPINAQLGKSLSTFYVGLGFGFDTVFNDDVLPDNKWDCYGALNFRIPIGFSLRASKLIELYLQNAFQIGLESTGEEDNFSITSDLEFGLKFWIQ